MSLNNRKKLPESSEKKSAIRPVADFMVGSPGQTVDTLYQDLLFIKELKPEMVGIGPFYSS